MDGPRDIAAELRQLAAQARAIGRKQSAQLLTLGRIATQAQQLAELTTKPRTFARWILDSRLPRSEVYKALQAHQHFANVDAALNQPRTVIELLASHPGAAAEGIARFPAERLTIAQAREILAKHRPPRVKAAAAPATVRHWQTPYGTLGLSLDSAHVETRELVQALAHVMRALQREQEQATAPPSDNPSWNPFRKAS